MRGEGDPLAPIAIPGWGLAVFLVVVLAVMGLIFWSMMRRLRADRERYENESGADDQSANGSASGAVTGEASSAAVASADGMCMPGPSSTPLTSSLSGEAESDDGSDSPDDARHADG